MSEQGTQNKGASIAVQVRLPIQTFVVLLPQWSKERVALAAAQPIYGIK